MLGLLRATTDTILRHYKILTLCWIPYLIIHENFWNSEFCSYWWKLELEENKISINNYLSQSYDNAAAMDEVSGKIPQNTLAVNPKFINCKNYRHTPCVYAWKLQTIVILFGCSWEIFSFFLSSISHWKVLNIIYLSGCEMTTWWKMEFQPW